MNSACACKLEQDQIALLHIVCLVRRRLCTLNQIMQSVDFIGTLRWLYMSACSLEFIVRILVFAGQHAFILLCSINYQSLHVCQPVSLKSSFWKRLKI